MNVRERQVLKEGLRSDSDILLTWLGSSQYEMECLRPVLVKFPRGQCRVIDVSISKDKILNAWVQDQRPN